MTTATPKPRAGEHVPLPPSACRQCGQIGGEHLAHCLLAERDLLRERERELVEALEEAARIVERAPNASVAILAAAIRALLAKHGR